MNIISSNTHINIHLKKPNSQPYHMQKLFRIQESYHRQSQNQIRNATFFQIQYDYQRYISCQMQSNEQNIKYDMKLKPQRKRKSIIIQIILVLLFLVPILLQKDFSKQSQMIPSVTAKLLEIDKEYDKVDGHKSPETLSNHIKEEEGFLKNIKISQKNDNNVSYIEDFDTQHKQTKSFYGYIQNQLYLLNNPVSNLKKDGQIKSFKNQKLSQKVFQKTQKYLTIEENKDIQQIQLQKDNQIDQDFRLNTNQKKRQLLDCLSLVITIRKPIDWWFRGNQYCPVAQQFLAAAGYRDWSQVKSYLFDSITPQLQVIQDYKELFNVIDPLCAPTSCWFDYIDDIFGGDLNHGQLQQQTDLTIDPSPNFGVKIVNKKNIQGSYKAFFMKCDFGGSIIRSYAVLIDQQPLDCTKQVSTIAQIEKQILFIHVSPFIRIEQISTQLFQNNDQINCPISACTIQDQKVCGTMIPSSEAQIYQDTVKYNNPLIDIGKCSQFKINCNFGNSGFQKESGYVKTKQLQKYYCHTKVSQITKPIDWWFRGNQYHAAEHYIEASSSLNILSQIKQYPFDQLTDQIQVIIDYTELFIIEDPICVPSSCRFLQIGEFYGGVLTLDQINSQTDLTIDPPPNFGVKFVNKKNYQGSYKAFIMICNFGGQEIQSKKVVIDQQPEYCSTKLTPIQEMINIIYNGLQYNNKVDGLNSAIEIPFEKELTFDRIPQIASLYQNDDPTKCPISNCKISSQIQCNDFNPTIPSNEGFIDASSPNTLKFNNPKDVLGKCSKLKVICQFGSANYQVESNWVITNQTKQMDQCSQNQISLLDKKNIKINKKFQLQKEKYDTIQKSQLLNLIKIQNLSCLLNYKLKQSSDQENYIDFKDQKIQFDALYNIQINSSKAFQIQDLYIEIESILSGQYVYIQLMIEVLNMNPIILSNETIINETNPTTLQEIANSTTNQTNDQNISDIVNKTNELIDELNQINETNLSTLNEQNKTRDQLKDDQQNIQINQTLNVQNRNRTSSKKIYKTSGEKNNTNQLKPKIPLPFIAYVQSISSLGLLLIKFNTSINSFDLSLLNNTDNPLIDIYVQPSQDTIQSQDYNMISLNFSWQPLKLINQNTLSIQLNFTHANNISIFKQQDILIINLYKNKSQEIIFKQNQSNEIEFKLSNTSWIIKSPIRKQMENTDFNIQYINSTSYTESSLKYLLIVVFILNFILSGAMEYMTAWIVSFQMIIHLPMLQIILTSNVISFLSIILPVIQYDLLSSERSTELILDFDEGSESNLFKRVVTSQMQDLGYSSHNSLKNLGSVVLYSLIYWLLVFFYFTFLKLFIYVTGKGKNLEKYLRQTLFFDHVITMTLECYINLIIAVQLNFYKSDQYLSQSGEIAGNFFSYYYLIIAFFILPITWIFLLFFKREKFENEQFKMFWIGFYEGINTKKKVNLFHNLIFILRRLIFFLIVFYLKQYPLLQVIITICMNFIICIFYAYYSPFQQKLKNRLNLFNEICNLLCSLFLISFTGVNTNFEAQYNMGWVLISIIIINMLVNISVVFLVGLHKLKLLFVKYYRLIKYKYKKYFNKQEIENQNMDPFQKLEYLLGNIQVKYELQINNSKSQKSEVEKKIQDQIKLILFNNQKNSDQTEESKQQQVKSILQSSEKDEERKIKKNIINQKQQKSHDNKISSKHNNQITKQNQQYNNQDQGTEKMKNMNKKKKQTQQQQLNNYNQYIYPIELDNKSQNNINQKFQKNNQHFISSIQQNQPKKNHLQNSLQHNQQQNNQLQQFLSEKIDKKFVNVKEKLSNYDYLTQNIKNIKEQAIIDFKKNNKLLNHNTNMKQQQDIEVQMEKQQKIQKKQANNDDVDNKIYIGAQSQITDNRLSERFQNTQQEPSNLQFPIGMPPFILFKGLSEDEIYRKTKSYRDMGLNRQQMIQKETNMYIQQYKKKREREMILQFIRTPRFFV